MWEMFLDLQRNLEEEDQKGEGGKAGYENEFPELCFILLLSHVPLSESIQEEAR